MDNNHRDRRTRTAAQVAFFVKRTFFVTKCVLAAVIAYVIATHSSPL